MAEDKVITLGPNELLNLVRRKKLSYIEGSDPPIDDLKFLHHDMAIEHYDSKNKLKLFVLFLRLRISSRHKMHFTTSYDTKGRIFNSKQGALSRIKYYGTLNGL
ncbi:hypothetical protein CR513_59701, partial [Mucuna pruriens]